MTIEQKAEEIAIAMVKQSWNENLETIAQLLRELEAANASCERLKWVELEGVRKDAEIDALKKAVDHFFAKCEESRRELKTQYESFRDLSRTWADVACRLHVAEVELEAARKVADAAVVVEITHVAAEHLKELYPDAPFLPPAEADATYELQLANIEARISLSVAVREYRALAEPPLSPSKQAVIARTLNKTDEEWQAIISGEVAP